MTVLWGLPVRQVEFHLLSDTSIPFAVIVAGILRGELVVEKW